MAQSEFRAQLTTVETYRGMNERQLCSNLENGQYSRTKGVSFRNGRASRIPGKVLKGTVSGAVMQMFQFGNLVLVQTPTTLLKTTVTNLQ